LTTVLVCSSNFAAGAAAGAGDVDVSGLIATGAPSTMSRSRGGERRKRPHEAVALRGCWFDALAGSSTTAASPKIARSASDGVAAARGDAARRRARAQTSGS